MPRAPTRLALLLLLAAPAVRAAESPPLTLSLERIVSRRPSLFGTAPPHRPGLRTASSSRSSGTTAWGAKEDDALYLYERLVDFFERWIPPGPRDQPTSRPAQGPPPAGPR